MRALTELPPEFNAGAGENLLTDASGCHHDRPERRQSAQEPLRTAITAPPPTRNAHGRSAAAAAGTAVGAGAVGAGGAPAGGAGGTSLDTSAIFCTHPQAQSQSQPIAETTYNRQTATYVFSHWPERARDLERCGRAGIRLGCRGCGEPTIVPYRCRSRTCPHAQLVAAATLNARLLRRIRVHDAILEVEPWDGPGRSKARGWKFLTTTLRVSTNPEENWQLEAVQHHVRRVKRAISRFWRLTSWGCQVNDRRDDGRRFKRSRRDTSYIVSIEIGTNGMVHAHWMIYGEYSPQAELAALWSQAIGERAIVDVRAIADPEEGLKEVMKYISKGIGDAPLPPRWRARIEVALKRVHRFRIGGLLRTIRADQQDGATEDLREEDVHDVRRVACEGCGCMGEWHWTGVVSPATVERNGGFGALRHGAELPPEFLEEPDG